MKVFLDTNVVVDFIAKRENYYTEAEKIVNLAENDYIQISISSLTAINVAYVLRKKMPKTDVMSKLKSFMNLCDISAIDKHIILEAIDTDTYDFEDKVQQLSALSVDADLIITRDEKGFSDCQIPVFTPSDFLAQIQR